MHKFIEKIKSLETRPCVINKFLNSEEVKLFEKLYEELPIEINNKRQKIVKKNGQLNSIKNFKSDILKN